MKNPEYGFKCARTSRPNLAAGKLRTHHPVIEPVSALRRERKFPPQRQAGKSRLIAWQIQFQRRAGSEKAPIPAHELRDCLRRFEP
jgi:hypothetical protein